LPDVRRVSAPSGITALTLGAVSIALSVIAAKQAIADGADTESLLAARLLVAAPVLVLLLPLVARAHPRRIGVRPVAVALGAGATLWVGGRAEFEGLARMPAGMLVVLLATAPLWVAFISWVASTRVLTRADLLALFSLLTGVAIMAAPIGEALDPVGVLFGLLSAISFAAFLFILERNERVAAGLGLVLGMIGAAIVLVITDPGSIGSLSRGIDPALVLAIGASAVLWTLFVGRGLGATDSVTTAIVVATEPVFVAVLAYTLLGEGMSFREIVGGSVALLALASVALRLRRQGTPSVPVG
jgi:drug/metabolite transporter (DMT)-like permease